MTGADRCAALSGPGVTVTGVDDVPYEVVGVLADGRPFLLRERCGNLTVRVAPDHFDTHWQRWPYLPNPVLAHAGFGPCSDADAAGVLARFAATTAVTQYAS